ncbi:MAG: ABC transporter permease subunit, partial [Chloroflexota bacterium]
TSRIGIFHRIIVPLSMPIIVAVAAFSFIARWNDLIGPLIYLNSTEKQVAAVGLALFRQENFTEVNLMMAAAVITVLPIVVVFFLAQKSFVQGVTLTGLKEG